MAIIVETINLTICGPDPRVDEILARLADISSQLNQEAATMALDFSTLESDLSAEGDAIVAVGQLVDTLIAEVQANSGNQAAIDAAVAEVQAHRDALVAAVLKGTPADPAPAPTPDPAPAPTDGGTTPTDTGTPTDGGTGAGAVNPDDGSVTTV